jgi:long-chain acyl-CoA synthetase
MPGAAGPDPFALRHEVHYGRVVRCYRQRPSGVWAMFEEAVARAPNAVAAVDGPLRHTYAELSRLVERCSTRLRALNVGPGDRVALLLDNRTDILVALLAIARIGAISVPMNIRQRRPETAFALQNCGAVLLIHEAAIADQLPSFEEAPSIRTRLAVDETRRLWDGSDENAAPPTPADQESPFCILYTSGTTGRPKGAVLTHLGVVTSCMGAQQHLNLHDGESTVLCVPASHVTGVILVLLLMVRVAGKTVMQRGFKARQFLELAASERMTYVIMVPAMYTLCLMEAAYESVDLSSWRVGAYGGAPMPEAVLQSLAAKTPGLALSNCYGATETTSPAVIMPSPETPGRLHQLGRPLSYCDLIVMSEDGEETAPGEQGEIWIAGPMVVPGYWNNPEATAQAFSGGFWKTGDLGAVDADGFVSIFDRKKDVINRGGYKVYSVEVENTLVAHASVVEAGVVGRPCPVLGERVEAFVVTNTAVDPEDLRAYCAEQLSDYKVPDHITVVEGALPRNPNGKLLKTVLRQWVQERTPTARMRSTTWWSAATS